MTIDSVANACHWVRLGSLNCQFFSLSLRACCRSMAITLLSLFSLFYRSFASDGALVANSLFAPSFDLMGRRLSKRGSSFSRLFSSKFYSASSRSSLSSKDFAHGNRAFVLRFFHQNDFSSSFDFLFAKNDRRGHECRGFEHHDRQWKSHQVGGDCGIGLLWLCLNWWHVQLYM